MEASKDNIRIQKIAVFAGVVLLLVKFAAYFFTGSNSILSDALESIVNVAAGVVGLVALIVSAIPRDENHPYGHEKVEFVSAAVEGAMIVIAGVFIIGKSIYNFIYPAEVERLGLGLILTGIAGLVNFALGFFMERKGIRNNSLALEASGAHLKMDAYTSAGLLIGIAIIWLTGLLWLDNIVASIFGAVLIYTGVRVLRRSMAGILDEADIGLVKKIISLLESRREDSWIDLHNFRVIRYGNRTHIDSHLTVPNYFTVQRAHDELEKIGKVIEDELGDKVELFVHIDPCVPSSCRICSVKDCSIREAAFTRKVPWSVENFFPDSKH